MLLKTKTKMEKQIRIGLWIIVAGLSYFLYSAIMNPIQFNKEKNQRSEKIINQLKDIRKAQIAFKEINRYYASNFDELITLIDTGEFTIGERREEELRAGKIKAGTLSVQVFEARAPKEEYLKDLDKDLIKNTSKDLVVGSMNSAKINGNWE